MLAFSVQNVKQQCADVSTTIQARHVLTTS